MEKLILTPYIDEDRQDSGNFGIAMWWYFPSELAYNWWQCTVIYCNDFQEFEML